MKHKITKQGDMYVIRETGTRNTVTCDRAQLRVILLRKWGLRCGL